MGFYVRADKDVNIYVEDINPEGKKTILFIHGWPGNHNLFEYQFAYLPKLGFRCIGYDMRGFGRSDRPWNGYGYDRLADDLYAVITAMDLKNITLAGHSTGGAVAIRYLSRYEGFGVDKLILLAAAAPSLIKRSYFPYGLEKRQVDDIINKALTNRPQMLSDFGDMIFHNYVTPGISRWIFDLGMQASAWGTAAIANTWIEDEGLFYDLEKIYVKTLIFHGLNDKVCLFPLAKAQHASIRNSVLLPLDSCGHFLFYDKLDEVNNALAEFG